MGKILNDRIEKAELKNTKKQDTLIKSIVLDKRTNTNSSMQHGDFVICCNCGRRMLVNIGTDDCPVCRTRTLDWEDRDNEEVADDFFYKSKRYILTDEDRNLL